MKINTSSDHFLIKKSDFKDLFKIMIKISSLIVIIKDKNKCTMKMTINRCEKHRSGGSN